MASQGTKEYQTLFWVPMLFQTASASQAIIDDMLDMIQTFHDNDQAPVARNSVIIKGDQQRRRQQILGDMLDSEVKRTTVEVVPKSENTKYTILSVLKSHFLFSQLHDYELEDVIDAMQEYFADENEYIIREGDSGDVFYVLEEGTCEITINGEYIGRIEEHSSFGDLALMYNSPRAATIRAVTYCRLWTLDRVFFRQAMVTSSSNQNVQLCQFLSKISLFENLGTPSLNKLARSLTKQSYDDGTYIIRQGEIGEQFFVIFKGTVHCTRTGDNGEETSLVYLHEGEVFGERALIKKEPRAANVIAVGDVECYFLDRNNFTLMLGGIVDRLNQMNEFRILRSVAAFANLSDNKLKILRKILNKYTLLQGQKLLVTESSSVYIITEGKLQSESGTVYSVGDMIGSLDGSEPEQVMGDVVTLSEECVVIAVHKQTFYEHVANAEGDEEMSRRNSSFDLSPRRDSVISRNLTASLKLHAPQNTTYVRSQLTDFTITKALGRGTFGYVYQALHKTLQTSIAMKCLDKSALVQNAQQQYVRREAIALQHFSHPFIVEYYGIITTPRKVIFLLEHVVGVELWTYLYRNKKLAKTAYGGLEMPLVTLFSGCILLALEHIHNKGYAYRDLKPENLLIGADGYIKLVDFGFAKPVPFMNAKGQTFYRTFTLCGTPDYMAPEVVLTQGHDSTADFWAFGVLLFELLCGHTPFAGRNQQRTFEKIVHSQKHLHFPAQFNPHAKSLIRRLLHPNASLRIGCLQNGCNDVKEHAFYSTQNISFEKLAFKQVQVPFIPSEENVEVGDGGDMTQGEMPLLDINEELWAPLNREYDEFFEGLSNENFIADLDD